MKSRKPEQRIVAIDLLRGFALLGILLMNMSNFAMPDIAYFNPKAYGGSGVWDRMVFNLNHIFADQKMMAIFSMLFGASVMLITNNLENKGKNPFSFHFTRNFWLLIIGLIHAILIWDGDILVIYAISSFVIYWFRRWNPKWQFVAGLMIFLIPSILNLGIHWMLPYLDPNDLHFLQSYWQPSDAAITTELERIRGSYSDQLSYRLWGNIVATPYSDGQGLLELSLVVEFFCRAIGMMMVGMAYYSWQILTGERDSLFYKRMVLYGFSAGLLFVLFGLHQYETQGWSAQYSLFLGRIPNHIGTPLVASGYIGLIMLWSRTTILSRFQERLIAVGRTALTNYIGQSVIATFIFYGFGLGLFGYLNRSWLVLVIIAIWVMQLIAAPSWLRTFRYGPLEWIWRSLSYFKRQPLVREVVSA